MKKSVLAAALAGILAGVPAGAVDLTGTWEGSYTCKSVDTSGESSTVKTKPSTLSIEQAGETFDAAIDGMLEYRGAKIDDPADAARRGTAVLVSCGADPIPLADGINEIVQLKVKVDAAKGTGTLTGTSVLEHGMIGIATCKFKYKRTSTTPTPFDNCSEL